MVTLVLGFLMRSLLFILVLAALAILVARFGRARSAPNRPGGAGGPSTEALSILQQRYARGDITRAEYLSMRRDLEQE